MFVWSCSPTRALVALFAPINDWIKADICDRELKYIFNIDIVKHTLVQTKSTYNIKKGFSRIYLVVALLDLLGRLWHWRNFLKYWTTVALKLMKGKALRKHSLHEKTAASVLLNNKGMCVNTPFIYEPKIIVYTYLYHKSLLHQ